MNNFEKTGAEIQVSRDHYANEAMRIQMWLTKNKYNKNRDHYLKELEKVNKKLRELNAQNKHRGMERNNMFFNVVKDCIHKDQFMRIRTEAESRLSGNPPKTISILRDMDEEIIEKYPQLEKKHAAVINKTRSLLKNLDDMMISTKGEFSAVEWNRIQEFNKQILKVKRELNEVIK